jgi:hypothetical protein
MTMTEPDQTIPTFAAPGLAGMPGIQAPADAALKNPADRTVKADVLAELSRAIKPKSVTLAVPDREGYSVDFDCRLDADILAGYSKMATTDGELDIFVLSLLVIAGQCRGIRRHGEVLEVDGGPLLFTSPALMETYGSIEVTSTVRRFYGDDNAVAATFGRIQREAQAGSLDPTPVSSS